jgi:N-methylhydantoinase A
MRFEGQGYDVTVSLDADWLARGDTHSVRKAFLAAHVAAYGHATEENEVWFKELRAHVVGARPRMTLRPAPQRVCREGRQPGEREIRLGGAVIRASVIERAALGTDARLIGPAIVDQMDTTTLIPPGWTARVMGSGALILERAGAEVRP